MRLHHALCALLLLCLVPPAFGQKLYLGNIDISGFPTIRAKVYPSGADGKRIAGLTAADFIVTENGVARTVTGISCPPEKPATTVSVAMSIDISGSMGSGPGMIEAPVELGKTTATSLANLIYLPPSEMALQVCDSRARILQDFTSDRNKILNAISPIAAGGGNDFVEHLLNPLAGILNVAKLGRYRRVAVLYTDAWWGPLGAADMQRCKDICARYDIRFYAVIYSRPEAEPDGIKKSLRELAEATGGRFYDGVTSIDAARAIATILQQESQGAEPCELEWQSTQTCGADIANVVAAIPARSLSATGSYPIPSTGKVSLETVPRDVSFLGSPGDKDVTITALHGDVTITGIVPDGVYFTVSDYGGSPPPFLLRNGESRTIRVAFVSTSDSIYAEGVFTIQSNYCDQAFYAVGGDTRFKYLHKTLTLTRPNGGEVFPVGLDTVITWKGLSPRNRARLAFSADNGTTWLPIATDVDGLAYRWTVPNMPSDKCLARITEITREVVTDTTISRDALVLPEHVGGAIYGAWSPDGLEVATMAHTDHALHFWDAITGQLLTPKHLAHKSDAIGNLEWSADSREVLSAKGDWDCLIWDVASGTLRTRLSQPASIPDNSKDYLYTAHWSPDGRSVLGSGYSSLFIWDAATGAIISWIKLTPAGYHAFWSKDGKSIAVATNNGSVFTWDGVSTTPTPPVDVLGGNTISVGWNAGAGLMAMGNDAGSVVVVDPATGYIVLNQQAHAVKASVTSIALSPDGTRLLTCASDATATLWNVPDNKFIGSLVGHGGEVTSGAWASNGLMIATACTDRNVRVWDGTTGALLHTLTGHTSYLLHVIWNPEGTRILSSSTDGSARIWSLVFDGQKDTSDAVWSIVAPKAVATDIDMRQVLVGASRDSLVLAVVRNVGTYGLDVRDISIAGPDAADFRVVSGFPPKVIPPGDSMAVEFRFSPSAAGMRNATLQIWTGGDTLLQNIFGAGIQPSLEVVSTLVDFGTIPVTTSKDTVVAATIRNIGTSPLAIDATPMLGPDMAEFAILSGGGAFTLAPGDEHTMTLRFSALATGRTSGRIGFAYGGPGTPALGSPAVMELFGRGIGGTVYMADNSAMAGQHTSLALVLDNGGVPVKGLAGQRFQATVQFNQTLLAPEDRAQPGTIAGGLRTISVDGVWDGAGDTLAHIPMVALLGNAENTSLDITGFDWLDNDRHALGVATETRSGTFTLLGICREGTTRLYDENGVEAALKVAPNPASGAIDLQYDLAEDGMISIDLYDAAGTRVRSLVAGERTAGNYRLKWAADGLPSGPYILLLRTPTRVVSSRVDIYR